MLPCVSAFKNGDGDRRAEAQALADASSWVLQLSGAVGDRMMVFRDCGIEMRCDTIFCSNKHGRLIPPFSVSVLLFLSAPQSKYSLPRSCQQPNSLQTCFHLQVVVLVDLVTLLSEPLLTSDSLLCLFEFFPYWVEIIFFALECSLGLGLGRVIHHCWELFLSSWDLCHYWDTENCIFSQSKLNKSTWLLLETSFC